MQLWNRKRKKVYGEKPADWYDDAFETNPAYHCHYTQSGYYFLWTVIIERLRRANPSTILEIGCGTGQLANAITDNLDIDYLGFDFSCTAIAAARKMCPAARFEPANALSTDLYDEPRDVVICTEVLEHIEQDTDVMAKLYPCRFIGSVPNYRAESHVRYFANAEEVKERYGEYFSTLTVDTFLLTKTQKFFLLDGLVL